jgi:hypothetical protein
MSNANYREEFKQHLLSVLATINDNYIYHVNWFQEIEKSSVDGSKPNDADNILDEDKTIIITLHPLPSRNFGDSAIVQQLEIQALVTQSKLGDAIDIFSDYQNSQVQKKWWTDSGTLVTESWFSPTIQQNFLPMKKEMGALVSLTGTITFTSDVVDVTKVMIFNEWNKLYEFFDGSTSEVNTQQVTNKTHKESANNCITYTVNLKCKNTNSVFCQTCRNWKFGKIPLNTIVPVKQIYTDNITEERNMIITSVQFSSTEGTIPTIAVTLVDAIE